MTDIIIIAVVVIIILLAARPALKHMKGQGSCCGGGSSEVPTKKKKLKSVAMKKVVTVKGMHCDHCKNRVMRAINELEGASANVNVSKGQAVVSMEQEISDDTLKAVIEKAGYMVIDIKMI